MAPAAQSLYNTSRASVEVYFLGSNCVTSHWIRRSILTGIVLTAFCSLTVSQARSEDCPATNRLERLGKPEQYWMILCIPPGNDLYRVEQGKLAPLYWRGDLQIPKPAGYDPGTPAADAEVTFIDVFQSDRGKASAIFEPMIAGILKAAQASGGNGNFETDVAFNGHEFPVQFDRLDDGLLKGTYSAVKIATGETRTIVFFLHPSGVTGSPHFAMCGAGNEENGCFVFTRAADQEVMMAVLAGDLDRAFRLSEAVAGNLNAFAMPPTIP